MGYWQLTQNTYPEEETMAGALPMERKRHLPANSSKQQPPHSEEAEKGVIGSMLCDPRTAIPIARQMIGSDQIYTPIHRTIFDALVSMLENEGDLHKKGLITEKDGELFRAPKQ